MATHAASAALTALAPCLRCPNCGSALDPVNGSLGCDRGHRFDLGRQGHVALPAPGRSPARGDSAEMVAARSAFLAAGHYAPIAEGVVAAARQALQSSAPPRLVVDSGAGTGYYLGAVLEDHPEAWGLALDSSRPALRRALRSHARIGGVVCDVWQGLPVQAAVADLILNVFAPRNPGEIDRILAPRGALITVTPTARHLQQLVARLGLLGVAADKQARLHAGLSPHLESVARRELAFQLSLSPGDVAALVAMGPSAHHLDAGDVSRATAALPREVGVTAAVVIETFRRAGTGGAGELRAAAD